MKKLIYLDNAATTKTAPEVVEAMLPYFSEAYGNPSSIYSLAGESRKAVDQARETIAGALGARPEEIYFTAGGTESDNWALKAAAEFYRKKGNHIITTKIEHHAVLHSCQWLEKQGFEVTYLNVDENGVVRLEELKAAIRPTTILISVMYANNEIGTIQPIREIGEIAHEHGILFHTDAVQAFGQLPIQVDDCHIDMLSASGHKLNGPKGIGFLYIRKGVHIPARTVGGGQEKAMRSGTEAMPAWCAFGAAVQALPSLAQDEKEVRVLWDYCREQISAIPDAVIQSPEDGLPYILNFSCGGVKAETMLHFLEERGIYVSSGSACAKGKASHVLEAMQLPRMQALSTIRVSFSRENTLEDAQALVQAVREGMETLVRAKG